MPHRFPRVRKKRMFTEVQFSAPAGLRRAATAYVRRAVAGSSPAPLTRDRSSRHSNLQRLEMELGYLLRPAGRRQPVAFARANAGMCEVLVRQVLMALRGLFAAEALGGLLQKGCSVYVSLFAVEPGAAAQEVHSDAPDKAKGSYTTVVVPLTGHRGQGTTEFARGGGFAVPRGDGAYAFDGRAAHRGGANLSRGWRCALCVVVCKGGDPNRLGGGSTSWAGHF